jgi:hypothetical protein
MRAHARANYIDAPGTPRRTRDSPQLRRISQKIRCELLNDGYSKLTVTNCHALSWEIAIAKTYAVTAVAPEAANCHAALRKAAYLCPSSQRSVKRRPVVSIYLDHNKLTLRAVR